MKTLVVTTGKKDYIINKYLPTLKRKGEYNGDILLVNYINLKEPLNKEDIRELSKTYNVMVKDIKYLYPCIASDRMRAFYECLKEDNLYEKYDVIMVTDGDDIEYFMSIQPLLEIAKDTFSYVIETPKHVVRNWIRFAGFPNADIVWKGIKDKPMINAGMMIGPADKVYEALEFMTEQMKLNKKRNDFGADQLLLNALIYYYNFPSQVVGYEWNYVIYTDRRRKVGPIKGRIFAIEDGKEIAIFHRNGPKHMDLNTWKRFVFPACKMPNEGWMNRR